MSAMRPTTAFLRLPGTAGVISAFCSSGGAAQRRFEGAQLGDAPAAD